MQRKVFSIRIDPNIYQTARKLDLNVSRLCENTLKQEIQRLTIPNPKIDSYSNPFLSAGSFGKESAVAGPRGFEPRNSGSAGQRLIQARPRAQR